jgi:antitoxin (DNA-binding transcriptional repressor) of toxin-antitoxin stability system
MRIVNIQEAKTHLSRLVEQAAKGEPFVIAKAGNLLLKSWH